ncbi:MAG: hypothetical protein ACPGVU_24040 [Limisphaerales bacterium]
MFKAVVACLCIGLAGVGYVWQKNQLLALGKQMKKKEEKLEQLRLENQSRQQSLTYLRSPVYLEKKIKALRLGLTTPHPNQIVTLEDAGVSDAAKDREVYMVKRNETD